MSCDDVIEEILDYMEEDAPTAFDVARFKELMDEKIHLIEGVWTSSNDVHAECPKWNWACRDCVYDNEWIMDASTYLKRHKNV